MRKTNLLLATVSLISLSVMATPAFADEDGDVVVVTAGRKSQDADKVGQSVSIIDEAQIKNLQQIQLPELLKVIPGVTVTRNGGAGNAVSVKIRGAASYQTVAMVDGVKLSDPSALQCDFNLGTILVGNIERIEVVRGSQSVLWGSQAMGGVINMITKKPTNTPETNIQGEFGSYNTQNYVANTSGKVGGLSASLGVNYFDTDGFSAFNKNRGGVEKDGNHNFGANTKLNYEFNDAFSINAMGFYTKGKGDFDDTGSDALNKQSAEIKIGYLGANYNAFDGKFKNTIGYSKTQTEREYYYPAWASTYNYKGDIDRYNYQGTLNLRDDFGLVFGAEREEMDYTIDSGYSIARANQKTDALFIQADAKPTENLAVSAGLRNEHHNLYGDHLVFDINGSYSFNNGNSIIRASYGEGYRAPSLYELYDAWSGNKDLVPEESQSKDIGYSQKLLGGKLVLGATYFSIESKNLINWSGVYKNVKSAEQKGVELEAKYQPTQNLSFNANYTDYSTEDKTTGKELARRPDNTAYVSVDYLWGIGVKTGLGITHVGDSYDNDANSILTKGYTIGDLRLSYKLNEKVEFFGRVENITDKKYETVYTYGTPGRSYYGGVRLSF